MGLWVWLGLLYLVFCRFLGWRLGMEKIEENEMRMIFEVG